MDTTRGILFLVVTLIIIVSVYYIVKMFKGKRTPTQPSPSPSPSDQTDEISISDLKFERTLNPDKSNSKGGDIVGYTIEYAGVDYTKLSKNVTFTLTWKNNIGFTDNVKGFKIEHYVSGKNETFDKFTREQDPVGANQSKVFDGTIENPVVNIENFGENKVSIVSDGNYSVVGKNRFKISVIMKDNTEKNLYDGLDTTNIVDDSHEIVISEQDLGATLDMTEPQTVKYTPVTRSFSTTTVQITKIKYDIYNDDGINLGYSGSGSIYLIPASSGTTTTTNADGSTNSEKTGVDTFFFQYELDENKYLLYDGSKGDWNKSVKRYDDDTIELNDNNTTGNEAYDNRMYVSFYNKDGNRTQLRAPVMGRGFGGYFLTSKEDGTLILKDLSGTVSVSETEFKNSEWTFDEVEGEPVNCIGYWVVNDTGTVSGTKKEEYRITTEMQNNGQVCPHEHGDTKQTDVDVPCQGTWSQWSSCSKQCGSGGVKTRTYTITQQPKHSGQSCPTSPETKSCYMGPCLVAQ